MQHEQLDHPVKKAMVVGASGGIGLAITRPFLRRRATTVATARRPSEKATLSELSDVHGDQLTLMSLEVCDDRSLSAIRRRSLEQRWQLDLLFDASGVL